MSLGRHTAGAADWEPVSAPVGFLPLGAGSGAGCCPGPGAAVARLCVVGGDGSSSRWEADDPQGMLWPPTMASRIGRWEGPGLVRSPGKDMSPFSVAWYHGCCVHRGGSGLQAPRREGQCLARTEHCCVSRGTLLVVVVNKFTS